MKKILLARWFALIVIALAAFVVYSNTWRCPFVFDDIHSIVENTGIRDLSNFSSPGRFFDSRAVVNFTFALNYKFGRLDVFGYHLVNILIHILNGFVVYFLALSIFDTDRLLFRHSQLPIMALFAALIFVAHPIQTQAVTYIVQRYASLAAFFYMGSVLFYLKARIRQGTEVRGQRTEVRGQRTEVRGQRSEVGGQGSGVRGQRGEGPSAFSFQLYTSCLFCAGCWPL